jgi:hypothetical protein
MNGDDVFIAQERVTLSAQLKSLEKEKVLKLEQSSRRTKAIEILNSKNESQWSSSDLKELIAWKSGKSCPSKLNSKASRHDRWLELKESEEPMVESWSISDEQGLTNLKEQIERLTIDSTALAREREKAKKNMYANIPTLTVAEKQRVQALMADEEEVTNVIVEL